MTIRYNFFLLILLFFPFSAFSQQCINVELDHKLITCLRSGIGSISAQMRVKSVEEKILTLANNYHINPDSINIVEAENTYSITSQNSVLLTLSKKDLDKDSRGSLEQYTNETLNNIKNAISTYRSERSSKVLTKGIVYSVIALIIFLIFIYTLKKIENLLTQKTNQLVPLISEKLKVKSHRLLPEYRLNSFILGTISLLKTTLSLVALYILITTILSFFPWTDHYSKEILEYVTSPLKKISAGLISYIPDLIYVILIFTVTRFFLKFVKVLFEEIGNETIRFKAFHPDWADPTYKLIVFLFYSLALVMAFPYLPGSSSPAFQGLSVFLGVLVSFGSGSAISNIISGIVITYMRPFKVGDRVRIADTQGDIVEKTFLVTRVKTIKNVDITIPNSMVLGSHIINFSSSAQDQGLILNTTVTIGYDAPWAKVHELLKEAAKKTKLIDRNKEPFILQTALNDFYVSYELNAYTQHANKMAQIYSDLHQNIQDVFNVGGVEIMSPHYASVRDGNETTIPSNYRGEKYVVPGFNIDILDKKNV